MGAYIGEIEGASPPPPNTNIVGDLIGPTQYFI